MAGSEHVKVAAVNLHRAANEVQTAVHDKHRQVTDTQRTVDQEINEKTNQIRLHTAAIAEMEREKHQIRQQVQREIDNLAKQIRDAKSNGRDADVRNMERELDHKKTYLQDEIRKREGVQLAATQQLRDTQKELDQAKAEAQRAIMQANLEAKQLEQNARDLEGQARQLDQRAAEL